ncbi:MAG: hypothetical protein ACU0DW_09475 [Shimia sp.]
MPRRDGTLTDWLDVLCTCISREFGTVLDYGWLLAPLDKAEATEWDT